MVAYHNMVKVEMAEKLLVEHGATKIVSLWWSKPYVIGVLEDGRRLLVSKPALLPTEDPKDTEAP